MFENINKIDFISSEACNLNCSYCLLATKANLEHQHNINKEIAQAFRTGQYLNMYKQFFQNYNIDVNKIKRIELWGQEPTLTLDAFNTQIKDILDWLPNATNFLFSTNNVAYTERILECIDIFNEYFKYTDRFFSFHIQISFDGIDYIEKQRGVNVQNFINNMEKIINYLNSIILYNNFYVSFDFHGVLTMDSIRSQLYDKDQYWEHNNDFVKRFHNLITNKKVICFPMSAYFMLPYNATAQEGQELTEYAKQCFNKFLIDKENKYIDIKSPVRLICQGIEFVFYANVFTNTYNNLLQEPFNNINILNQNIQNIYNVNYNNSLIFPYQINQGRSCDINNTVLKLRYDGTLLYCEQTIFNLTEADLINREDMDYDLAHYQLLHPRFQPNILTALQEDVQNFIKIFEIQNNYNLLIEYTNIINLMYLLLQNNQIDASYNDINKILRHGLYVALGRQCYNASMVETGSFYTTTLGFIRTCCNGLLDYLENLYINNLVELGDLPHAK